MKSACLIPAVLSLSSILFTSCASLTGTLTKQEKVEDATFSYLAKRRGMNALRVGGEQLGTIGSVYAVREPGKKEQLSQFARNGRAISITPYEANKVTVPTFVSETTKYQVQNELASHIAAELEGKLAQQGASVSGFRDQLHKAHIRFTVTRRSTWERDFRNVLGASGYSHSDIPEDAAGLVTPMEVLVISDFTHDTVDTSTVEGKLAANYIEQLKGSIAIGGSSAGSASTVLPEPRIVAIRPLPLAFRQ